MEKWKNKLDISIHIEKKLKHTVSQNFFNMC